MDSQAFGRLYDAHVAQIYRYLYYRTRHRETAEDLTSLVFLKALDHLESYDAERGTFLAWIYRIAKNALTDHFRSARPTLAIDDVWDLPSDADVVRDAEENERLEKLRPFLRALPKDQRELLLLRLWDGLSHAEIAELTDRTEAAAKMAFSRVIARLRKDMPASLLLLLIISHRFL
jgi:RNA polymerase sigma-70 factor (ECF subfamily)